ELIKSLFNSNKNDFNYKEYWNSRLDSKFDIEGVGYIGLGEIYNRFLYESRFELLDYIVKNTFENIDRMSVLELGPGIGMFTDYFYKNNIKNYVAIDISEKSKEELSKKYKSFNFILGDISEEKNYPNSKFSLIFAADVLLHLTDEKRYMDLIRILSNSLADDGAIIIFDPITTINSKSQSPHLVIRDIKYIKDILKHNELELVEMIPATFFMNYPFDSNILEERSIVVEDMFNLIQAVFSSVYISDVVKEKLGEWISLRDKECLARNKFGLSQKVLVIKKKSNEINNNLKINDIWNLDKIRIRADKLKY
ncbi:class I SAM-dependent methyltransferase, partial [Clostridium tertium]